jgi:hypothetical protein
MDQQVNTRPWWRRVNATLVALAIAIGAVAAIAWTATGVLRKNTPTPADRPAATSRYKVEPRALVGALLPHHRRHRAHAKKRASPPAKQSARP